MPDLATSESTGLKATAARVLLGVILVGGAVVGCTAGEEPTVVEMPTAEPVVVTEEPASAPTRVPTRAPPTATPLLAAYSGNIVDLQEQGQLEVRVPGTEIDELTLELRNLTGDSLDVDIPAGTYFVSSNAAMQNMVVRHSQTVRLTDEEWTFVELEVACANIDRDVPARGTSFEIRRSPPQGELDLLMASLEQAGAIYDVEQAAVWIVSDDADLEGLATLVRTSVANPLGSAAIGYDDAATAMQLVDEAGINIRQRAIWGDRHRIAAGVENSRLAEWIDQRERQVGPGGEGSPYVVALLADYPVLGAAFVPETQQVVTSICLAGMSTVSCQVGEKQLWDGVSGELMQSFGNQPAGHDNLVFSQDGRLIASATCEEHDDDRRCLDGRIQLWDTASWAVTGVLWHHPDRVEAIAFSPDASSVASKVCLTRVEGLCTASEIWLWDVASREVTRRFAGFVQFSDSLAFSPDGQLLAAPVCAVPGGERYCQASEIWVWNTAAGTLIQRLPLDAAWRIGAVFTAEGDTLVAAATLLDDETSLATWLWQTDSWELASRVPIDEGELYTCCPVAFAPAAGVAAVGQCSFDEEGEFTGSNVLIWDMRSGAPIARTGASDEFTVQVGLSSDGAQVLVRTLPDLRDNRVILWPVR